MEKWIVTGMRGETTVSAPDEQSARTRAMEHFYGPATSWPGILRVYEGRGLLVRLARD